MGRRVYGKSRRKGWLIGFIICLIVSLIFLALALEPLFLPSTDLEDTTEYSATIHSVSHRTNDKEDYYLIVINEYDSPQLYVSADYIVAPEAMDSLSENTEIYFRIPELSIEDYLDQWEKYPMMEKVLIVCALKTETEEIVTLDRYNQGQAADRIPSIIFCSIASGILFVAAGFFLYKYIKAIRQEKQLKMYRGENNLQ